ncbi:Uu.00g062170.m01.CDS01 [Anthostomella pinea]|uniref:Uu.00g062170.m01.CDS01 n=1 Tax=Anthostomella pinea TaxID=933095 RepID=A0AAI8YKG6_9PEZI|nr:Uu.00g062170.m01.CDS01 [Anthostomella pinea]
MADSIDIKKTMASSGVDEKTDSATYRSSDVELPLDAQVETDLNVTENDLAEAKELAGNLTLEEVRPMMEKVIIIHENDPNFPASIVDKIKAFLGPDLTPRQRCNLREPEKHAVLIEEIKMEAALITVNSPYAEVRAVVDNHDDVNMPRGTIRAWVIGMVFAFVLAFVNQLFSIRQPYIIVQSNVAQLLAFPLGKACEKLLPDAGLHTLGLGPIPTSLYQPELRRPVLLSNSHRLGYQLHWLRHGWYYPTIPGVPLVLRVASLTGDNRSECGFLQRNKPSGGGPFRKVFTMTRLKFFTVAFFAMFVYFWFPNWTNTYNTAYLPLNSNRVFDNVGHLYNVTNAVDERGLFNSAKYEAYSFPFLAAGNLVEYMMFFAIYSATVSYTYLYHRHEITIGFKSLFNSFRKNKDSEMGQYKDAHNRLMASYREVPEWWYTIVLPLGTHTPRQPSYFYGLALCALFVIPVGIIKAMTGVEVTLNVLAEFIGGSWVEGNALAMNYFKSFGYVTCALAVFFSNDLKLAHYVKIPPRQTFAVQMMGTLISTLVCTGVLNFQMNQIPGVCTLLCSGHRGTHQSLRKGRPVHLVAGGFPIGFVVPFIIYYMNKKYKKSWMRQIHPVAIFYGALSVAPYNLAYIWPAVHIAWLSYNFALSASFSSAIAVAAIIMFFGLQWSEIELNWWGNTVVSEGCEGDACTLLTVKEGEYFGPRYGDFH